MPLGRLFKLEKLSIVAYRSAERLPRDRVGVFVAMFNPESLSEKYAIVYDAQQGLNTSGRQLRYTLNRPSGLALSLVLDGTGTQQAGAWQLLAGRTVAERVRDFLDLAFAMNGSTHEPNHLLVEWGDFRFPCRLASVDVHYTAFERDGTPLRANLEISLTRDESAATRVKRERKQSPDVSHSRVVRAGDTLPLLAREVYGSPEHYLWLAGVNDLDDFRQLTPGQQLVFPPLPAAGEAPDSGPGSGAR